jgi:hypothetical protein
MHRTFRTAGIRADRVLPSICARYRPRSPPISVMVRFLFVLVWAVLDAFSTD